MARTDTTEGQALWQPGGAEEGSCCHEGDRHLCLVCNDSEEKEEGGDSISPRLFC